MCGIVGLFAKTPAIEDRLGELLSPMLIEMTERGPDSAGVAFYRTPAAEDIIKYTMTTSAEDLDWSKLAWQIEATTGIYADVEVRGNHAVLRCEMEASEMEAWIQERRPEVQVISTGSAVEIYKEMGLPRQVVDQFDLRKLNGTHAIGHTRMATESDVTTEGCHPFTTGPDLCLAHNGSLSNHNRLRRKLQREGIQIKSENDSEVAAGYLTWRMRAGATLEEALESALDDLDGFFTFAVGTRDGFAIVRDPIACKHAVIAETDDWVAMATEYRAIATLPGADQAKTWEPEPAKIYSWSHR